MLESICIVIVSLVAVKAVTVGSDFSFYKLFKHGPSYYRWFQNRKLEQFDP